MPGGWRPPSWSPWVLCAAALALQALGTALRILRPQGTDDGVLYVVAGVLGAALMPIVGALIAARVPANPCGWLLCALGLLFGLVFTCDGLRRTALVSRWLLWLVFGAGFAVILVLLVLLVLLFPTGRLPAPAWRWVPRVAIVAAAALVLVLPFAPSTDAAAATTPWVVGGRTGDVLVGLLDASTWVLFGLIVVAAVSVLGRYRRADGVERQQLKWFLAAAGFAAGTLLASEAGVPLPPALWAIVDAVSFALLPVAIGIAVLRYRLYEIDRIVSRTVSWGLLTCGVVLLYLGLVALLRPLLEPLTGSSALAVAGSTLAVAAVFDPSRRRLQAVVDRRFDRARYDAARAVEAYAARLRDQVDAGRVVEDLRGTVAATLAPTSVAVWLREPPAARGV